MAKRIMILPYSKRRKHKKLSFKYGQRRIEVITDKFLIFNFFKKLHGRFWGVIALVGFVCGFLICFMIKPDLLMPSTALSDFGADVKTAPYFAGACFFAAYGLWRWRNYLERTLRRTQPIATFLTLVIFSLYLIALMPSSWKPWPYRIHVSAVVLMGLSVALTVIFDIMLSKTKTNQSRNAIKIIKITTLALIIIGAWLTLGSLQLVGWYNVSLLGESLMLLGFAIWVLLKTYQGEEPRSRLSKLLDKLILVN